MNSNSKLTQNKHTTVPSNINSIVLSRHRRGALALSVLRRLTCPSATSGVDLDVSVSIHDIPPNGWFTMENPIQVDDLLVPLFHQTPI